MKILQTLLFCYPYSSRTSIVLQWKSFFLICANLTHCYCSLRSKQRRILLLFADTFLCSFHHISQFLVFSCDISIVFSLMRKHTVCAVFNLHSYDTEKIHISYGWNKNILSLPNKVSPLLPLLSCCKFLSFQNNSVFSVSINPTHQRTEDEIKKIL